MSDALATSLADWEHMSEPGRAAETELLRVMAWAIDRSVEAVEGGAAALPLVNACKYFAEQLRRAMPQTAETDGLDEALLAAFDD